MPRAKVCNPNRLQKTTPQLFIYLHASLLQKCKFASTVILPLTKVLYKVVSVSAAGHTVKVNRGNTDTDGSAKIRGASSITVFELES